MMIFSRFSCTHLFSPSRKPAVTILPAHKKLPVILYIENLPGFPDGISSNGRDKFWLALVTPRQAVFDKMLPYPFVRKVVFRLPKFLHPQPQRYSFVLGLDSNGRVVENLQNDLADCYAQIANVVEHSDTLYFGSIGEDTVGRFPLR